MNAFYGAYTDSIPLVVPPFREITPKLALKYSSAGENGPLGVGWSVGGFSIIERKGRRGAVPQFDETDVYALDGVELVECADGSRSPSCRSLGTHSTKIESFVRVTRFPTDRWIVTTSDGVKTTYIALGTGSRTRVWGIWKVTDTFNNEVTYSWFDGGTNDFYPQSVTYQSASIEFCRGVRSDSPVFATGRDIGIYKWVINAIFVSVDGQPVRGYKLSYTANPYSRRARLTGAQVFGKDLVRDSWDEVAGGTSNPKITMTYREEKPGWTKVEPKTNSSGDIISTYPRPPEYFRSIYHTGGDTGLRIGDFNGDGLVDLLQTYFGRFGPSTQTRQVHRAYLNTGSEWRVEPWPAVLPEFAHADVRGDDFGVRLADLNGDGRMDVLQNFWGAVGVGSPTAKVGAWLNTPNGFVAATQFNPPVRFIDTDIPGGGDTGARVADINGDGRTDLLLSQRLDSSETRRAWINTGGGWTATGVEDDRVIGIPLIIDDRIKNSNFAGTEVVDVNGDGITDIAQYWVGKHESSNTIKTEFGTWLGTGTSYIRQLSYNLPVPLRHHENTSEDSGVRFGDLNGDGLVDIMQLHHGKYQGSSSWTTTRRSWINTGSSWQADNRFTRPSGTDLFVSALASDPKHGFGTVLMDINGDGLADVLQAYEGRLIGSMGGPPSIYQSIQTKKGTSDDLLVRIDNGAGGLVAIEYATKARFGEGVPMAMPLVKSVTSTVRGGAALRRGYSYEGGLYDPVERRSLGFRYVREDLPCITGEVRCPYVETFFRQDYGSVSLPEYIDRRSGDEKLLAREQFVYQTNGAEVPYVSHPVAEISYEYDPATGSARSRRTVRHYDDFGVVDLETNYGDDAVSGDEVTLQHVFRHNKPLFIFGRPAITYFFDGVLPNPLGSNGGNLIGMTRYYYDEKTNWDAVQTHGKVSAIERWDDTTNTFVPAGSATFDAHGNVESETDALGNKTQYAFDTEHQLYVVSTKNPLGHTTTATWDVGCAQRKTAKDANDQTTTFDYDAMCRLKRETFPNTGYAKRAYGTWSQGNTVVGSYLEVDGQGTLQGMRRVSRTYFDGFGRIVREERQGPVDKSAILEDTHYDARGNVRQRSRPYYEYDSPRWLVQDYDPLDRLVKLTFADGKERRWIHSPTELLYVDEGSHFRRTKIDAGGRIIERCEGVDSPAPACTVYTYTSDGRPKTITDPGGTAITLSYDSLGRQTRLVDVNAGTTTFSYYADGAVRKVVTGLRTEIEFTYDSLRRPTTRTARTLAGATNTVQWGYDYGLLGKGRLTSLTDDAGTTLYEYDVSGNPVKLSRAIDGVDLVIEKQYGRDNSVLWTRYPDGDEIGSRLERLEYDGAGRLRRIPGYVENVLYTAEGELERLEATNGTTTVRTLSATRGWVDKIQVETASETVLGLTYTARTNEGLVRRIADQYYVENSKYSYDDLHRLVTADQPGTSALTFTYDNADNLTNQTGRIYTYPSAGTARAHAVQKVGTDDYTYDQAGNLRLRPGLSIDYDVMGRPSKINGATFTYDAHGGRAKRVTATGKPYYYVGDDLVVAVNGSSKTFTKYLSIGGLLVGRKVGSEKQWLHVDELGSVRAITNGSGAAIQRYSYGPFGDFLGGMVAELDEFRGWLGQVHDPVGLIWLHARFYDPAIGRFLAPDPIIPESGRGLLNRYAYAVNDPVNQLDFDGLRPYSTNMQRGGYWREVPLAYWRLGQSIPIVGKYIGGTLVLLHMACPLYALHGDFSGWARATATVGVLVGGFVLASFTGQIANPVLYVAANGLIGFATSSAVMAINGGDIQASVMAGLIGGGTAMLGASFRLAHRAYTSYEPTSAGGANAYDNAVTANGDAMTTLAGNRGAGSGVDMMTLTPLNDTRTAPLWFEEGSRASTKLAQFPLLQNGLRRFGEFWTTNNGAVGIGLLGLTKGLSPPGTFGAGEVFGTAQMTARGTSLEGILGSPSGHAFGRCLRFEGGLGRCAP